jgi:SAM-dependent methyltransferase
MTEEWGDLELPGGRRLVRDADHGYLRVDPMPSDAELDAYYANAYRSPCVPHDPDGRVEIVTPLVPGPGRVLDIGCGAGEFLASFTARGWESVGVEPAAEYAARARARGIQVVEQILTPAVATTLGTFDVVLLAHVLEHVPRPLEMVRMVRGLLRPGGVFYCEVPNDFNPLQLAAREVNRLRPWWVVLPDHLNYFSLSSLASLLSSEGFDIEVRTTDFPVELFLLWGDVYVDNPELGRAMHQRRCRFEQALRETGRGDLLRGIYDRLAALEVGREAIVCGRRRPDA